MIDEDDVLDLDMDDVEAEPEFIDPTAGHYRFRIPQVGLISYDKKPNKDEGESEEDVQGQKEFMSRFTYQIVQILEAKDPAPPLGSLCSEPFGFQKKGKGYLKTRLIKLLGNDAVRGKQLRGMFEAVEEKFDTDYLMDAFVSIYKDKKGIDRYKLNGISVIKAEDAKGYDPDEVTFWYPSQQG